MKTNHKNQSPDDLSRKSVNPDKREIAQDNPGILVCPFFPGFQIPLTNPMLDMVSRIDGETLEGFSFRKEEKVILKPSYPSGLIFPQEINRELSWGW